MIERDELRRLSRLAHLELDDHELDSMTAELNSIVAYLSTLEAVAVEGVPATSHVRLERLPLRPDQAQPSLDREAVLDQAPAATETGFAVPTFVDEG